MMVNPTSFSRRPRRGSGETEPPAVPALRRLSRELGVTFVQQGWTDVNARSALLDRAIDAYRSPKGREPLERTNLFDLVLACFNEWLREHPKAKPADYARYSEFIQANAQAQGDSIRIWAYAPLTEVLAKLVPDLRAVKR